MKGIIISVPERNQVFSWEGINFNKLNIHMSIAEN